MSDHEPTVGVSEDQPGERLDADKVPEEFPDRPLHSLDYGTTEAEMGSREPLDDRLQREVPDADVGTQSPPEETTTTPLADDADESGRDLEKDLVSERPIEEPHHDDTAHPVPPVAAEEEAVRIEEDEDDLPGAVDKPAVRPEIS